MAVFWTRSRGLGTRTANCHAHHLLARPVATEVFTGSAGDALRLKLILDIPDAIWPNALRGVTFKDFSALLHTLLKSLRRSRALLRLRLMSAPQ